MKTNAVYPTLILSVLISLPTVPAADPFQAHVRPTEPLSPQEELESFSVPPGFKIQSFASEPDIGKPMNMAFDAQGRLWVTISHEYPYPAPVDKGGRDEIKVLEDTDGDGRADRVTTFVDGLNIPIGLYPYKNGVIAWSIPNIWFFEDSDGDGRADQRRKLFGPLGWERDTHGMNSSFTRGFDGWLHITHGFNNTSTVRGADGSEITMNSGNTYRVRMDGSRVEQYTWGQVNPFGMCLDSFGNFYTADCHSAPIYQLIRGGYYPSFGKPHDGLGFAPVLMEHSHGSTAISGIVYTHGLGWPEKFKNNILIGNVMTSEVNRDQIHFNGSSPVAKEMPSFVTSTDPWFRPVNLQIGPDDALYIADFYNRIIGHYEVPLDHPGRDRHRGRIWRVIYDPSEEQVDRGRSLARFDLTTASVSGLIQHLSDSNLTRRMLATQELVDRAGAPSIPPLRSLLSDASAAPEGVVHALAALHQMDALRSADRLALSEHENELVRVHAFKTMAEAPRLGLEELDRLQAGLADPSARVRRAAVEALGQHPAETPLQPILQLILETPEKDDHLRHTARVSLRNQLRQAGALSQTESLSNDSFRELTDVLLAVQTREAGDYILNNLDRLREVGQDLRPFLQHAAHHADVKHLPALTRATEDEFQNNPLEQHRLFQAVRAGLARRGHDGPEVLQAWALRLGTALLKADSSSGGDWHFQRADAMPAWGWEERQTAGASSPRRLLSSLPGGESSTGILKSPRFKLPPRLSFFMAGHSGFPNSSDPMRNFLRLRHSPSHELLREEPVPRNDIAQRYVWDLEDLAGEQGYLEMVDADDGRAYAWIAINGFEPGVVAMPAVAPKERAEALRAGLELARELKLVQLWPAVKNLMQSGQSTALRSMAANTAVRLDPDKARLLVMEALRSEESAPELRFQLAQGLAQLDHPEARQAVLAVLPEAPRADQLNIARSLASKRSGAISLLQAMETGSAPAHLARDGQLQERLGAFQLPRLKDRIESLTQDAAEIDARQQKQIDDLVRQYPTMPVSAERGAAVFEQACANCHQFNGKGSLVGPQLDGISARGIARVTEDILDANRNVDTAFRSHTLILKDGEVVTGLPRREEGELVILADAAGREIEVARETIQERRESSLSLMPGNFGDVLTEQQLADLLAFLLETP